MSDNKKHSIVSPSSASRWIACPPSARLNEAAGDRTSVHADEGSLAHRLAELWLLNELHVRSTGKQRASALSDYEAARTHPLFYDDMPDEVSVYTSHVMNLLSRAGKGARMYVEAELPLFYRPEDKGTIDNLIFGGEDKTLYVTDLKFGRGVLVDATHNKQLIIYALNAYDYIRTLSPANKPDDRYAPERIVMTIVQPRRDYLGAWEITVDEMESYRDEIIAKSRRAVKGEGKFKPGDHCMFCAVKARCKALKEMAATVAEKQFDDPALLTDSEVAALLGSVDIVADWVTSLKKYALERAVEGVKFEGWKLVEGKSCRKIADEKAILKGLVSAGYEGSLFRRSSFVTLGELENTVDKTDFEKHCAPYIIKPDAPPTLVEASDPRPEFGIAKARKEFKEFINK